MDNGLRLEDLRIASPCGVSWDDMQKVDGGESVRHCDHCMLNVYNIAGMSREDATAMIRSHEGGRVCIRMMRREDGTVITADCPVGLARVKRRVRRLAAGLAALLGLTGVSVALQKEAERTRLQPAVASQPFALISAKVFGRKAPPPVVAAPRIPMGRIAMGSMCVMPIASPPSQTSQAVTPMTLNGSEIPSESHP